MELEKLRSGARGTNFSDFEGMRMRPIALSITSDEDINLIAQFVESMPPVRHPRTLPGDPQAGAVLFATCAACHGDKGEGNQTIKSAPLAGLDDWYLATELRKFRSGVRGTDPRDTEGRIMRPMARTLSGEDAVRNVVAYVKTLNP